MCHLSGLCFVRALDTGVMKGLLQVRGTTITTGWNQSRDLERVGDIILNKINFGCRPRVVR